MLYTSGSEYLSPPEAFAVKLKRPITKIKIIRFISLVLMLTFVCQGANEIPPFICFFNCLMNSCFLVPCSNPTNNCIIIKWCWCKIFLASAIFKTLASCKSCYPCVMHHYFVICLFYNSSHDNNARIACFNVTYHKYKTNVLNKQGFWQISEYRINRITVIQRER